MLMIEDPVPSSLTADSLHRLEDTMQKVLDDWKVPGPALFLAVSVPLEQAARPVVFTWVEHKEKLEKREER